LLLLLIVIQLPTILLPDESNRIAGWRKKECV